MSRNRIDGGDGGEECDPIIEAGDDGEVLDGSADGAIECVADGEEEGMTVRVAPESELGERLHWVAGHRGEEPEELVADAISEFVEEQQGDARTDE